MSNGFRPSFYQSEYGRYYEDAVQDPQALIDFAPDLAYVHAFSCRDVRNVPPLTGTQAQFNECAENELARFVEIWNSLERNLGCQVVQNNFETPPYAISGVWILLPMAA